MTCYDLCRKLRMLLACTPNTFWTPKHTFGDFKSSPKSMDPEIAKMWNVHPWGSEGSEELLERTSATNRFLITFPLLCKTGYVRS